MLHTFKRVNKRIRWPSSIHYVSSSSVGDLASITFLLLLLPSMPRNRDLITPRGHSFVARMEGRRERGEVWDWNVARSKHRPKYTTGYSRSRPDWLATSSILSTHCSFSFLIRGCSNHLFFSLSLSTLCFIGLGSLILRQPILIPSTKFRLNRFPMLGRVNVL